MTKKRHLTVLQDHQVEPEEGRSPAFSFAVGTGASLLTWVLLGALINGALGEALASAGDVVAALVNLAGLLVSTAAGGALLASQTPRLNPWLARGAGALAAVVGWAMFLVQWLNSAVPAGPGVASLVIVFFVMVGAGGVGSGLTFQLVKNYLARKHGGKASTSAQPSVGA